MAYRNNVSLVFFPNILFSLIFFSFSRSKTLILEKNSALLFKGQSFFKYNITNTRRLGSQRTIDCEAEMFFKPLNLRGLLVAFASDDGTWIGVGLEDGCLRSFNFNQTDQLPSSSPKSVAMVTRNQWLHLSVWIQDTKMYYSLLGKLTNFTETLNPNTKFGFLYVGGMPVVLENKVEYLTNFTGFIKKLAVECNKNVSDSEKKSSRLGSVLPFGCHGDCNLNSSATAYRNKGSTSFLPSLFPTPSPLPYFLSSFSSASSPSSSLPIVSKEKVQATQSLGFINGSIKIDKIDVVMTNTKRSPPQNPAKALGITKIYKVTVILIIFLFISVSLYVLGILVKNKIQRYRAKIREERQAGVGVAGRVTGDMNSFISNRSSNLYDLETGTHSNEQFWREKGKRLLTVQGNQLRMSASTQSLTSNQSTNLNDVDTGHHNEQQAKFWRERSKSLMVKPSSQMCISASTQSLNSRNSLAVCESSLFFTPQPLRKCEGTYSKGIPRVVFTGVQDEEVIINLNKPLKPTHGKDIKPLTTINGTIANKAFEKQCNQQGIIRKEAMNGACKNTNQIKGFTFDPLENGGENTTYKWAYIRPDSETECSETSKKMRHPNKTNTFRPCSLRILETNESEEEDDDYNNKKSRHYDELQTFRCRSSDNVYGGEPMKISYDPCLSSSQGERLVCFGIHSASSDPSVASSCNAACDCSAQQRFDNNYGRHYSASVDQKLDPRRHMNTFMERLMYNEKCPREERRSNVGFIGNNRCEKGQTQLGIDQCFSPKHANKQVLLGNTEVHRPNIPPLPPSSLQLQQRQRQQLKLCQPTSSEIWKEKQNIQKKNNGGQRARLLRQERFDLPNPRPHSTCNFTQAANVNLYQPIKLAHASSCDLIPRWTVTSASLHNSNESGDDNAQKANAGINQKGKEETNKRLLENPRDAPVANSDGFKSPWILRPNVASKKNDQMISKKAPYIRRHVNQCHPRHRLKANSSRSLLVAAPNKKDGEGVERKGRRSSWASGNRPSEFEFVLKGTVPVKRPPCNTSNLLTVPGSRTRP